MKILNKIFLVMLMGIMLVSAQALADVGNIIYGYGSIYALDHDGNKRKLGKGSEIFEGDTLVTGKNGRMHVRFSDGGMVSVYPHSEYKIDEYRYVAGDDTKQKGFFSLLRGGARQITGLLGKIKHDNFRFRTVVATIGIRGTGFFVKLCQADCYDPDGNLLPDGMYVKNDTGIITMKTDAGDIDLAQGQSAFAASSNDEPQQINEPPAPYNLALTDVELFDFDTGDAVDAGVTQNNGVPPVTPPAAVVLTRLESAFIEASSGVFPGQHNVDTAVAGNTITHGSSTITAYDGADSGSGLPAAFDSTGASLQESGADQALGVIWSRWTGNSGLTVNGSAVILADNNVHLIGAAALTPTLPTSGTISYQSLAGTLPTFVGPSSTAVGTQSIAFDINYGTGELSGLSVTADFAGNLVTASQLTVEFISGNANVISLAGTCAFAICNATGGTSMSGNISINLVGANAEGAYGTYNLSNGFDAGVVGSYLATDVTTQ